MTNPRLEFSRCCGTACDKPLALRQIRRLLDLFKLLTRFPAGGRRVYPKNITRRIEAPVEVFDPVSKARIGVFIPDAKITPITSED